MTSLRELLGRDPSEVPARLPDGDLTPVATSNLNATSLRELFRQPPQWQPQLRSDRARSDSTLQRPAAVLIPIVMHDEPTVLLTQRTAHLPTHAGQIAFPGGKIDSQDADARAAALREADEEIELDARSVELLGTLPTYHTASGFAITPVVGLVPAAATWRANPQEVQRVFEVPLAFLMNPLHHRIHEAQVAQQTLSWWSMPYVAAEETLHIWGATAAILRNLYCMMRSAQSMTGQEPWA